MTLPQVTSPAKVVLYVKPKLPKPYKIPFPIKGNLQNINLFRASKRNKLPEPDFA